VRRSRYKDNKAFVTKDGSLIRELLHPSMHGNAKQSLAEAVVAAGKKTQLHQHAQTEELYHITAGKGEMTLADETFKVIRGDTVCIPPGTPHCIKNTSEEELVFLCCCAPAYSHDDTQLLE
jgi:mannose-6-phosphate isomerase-like protein (cupin superfamily)